MSVPTPAPFPMRRGVNLGNALEAPTEGEWGYRIEPAHLAAIAEAGFDGVRLPVRWGAHAAHAPPYAIETGFLLRVAAIIDACLALGLHVQLDCHHYEALLDKPDAERARYLSIWRQIAVDQQDAPGQLMFEPLNEPHGNHWTGAYLAELQVEVIAAIRETNPRRLIVLGGPNWNSIDGLREWRPPADPHIAATVHYYEPHDFTHQDGAWLGADAPHFGRAWGTPADLRLVRDHAARAARWAAASGLALQLGEFGVNGALPLAQRALWTRAVREAFDAEGAGWCAWDFAGAFPIWDLRRGVFIPEMRDALIN